MRLFLAAALLVGSACGHPPGAIDVALAAAPATHASVVRVLGLSSDELASLRRAALNAGQWSALLRVTVANGPADAPAIAGRFSVTSAAVEFAPSYPFDPGREYAVVFDASRLPVPRSAPSVRVVVSVPSVARSPSTTVLRMLPTADVLPENLLRVYLEFSAPMSRENGRDYLRLIDEAGREVPDAFLSLDIEFWSPDYRRYTLFFDPGRVKRGILPNDQMGRALRAGRRYTIEVDQRWRDADGQPLAAPFRRTFAAGPAEMQPIRLADWTIAPPRAGTRDALSVAFPKPLDHGLLNRAIGVVRAGQRDPVSGDVAIGSGERAWTFTPRGAWPAGDYELVVLAILEDPAGNQIDRPFDVDRFERIDATPAPDRRSLPFAIR
jgi:hypothetical protein